MRPIGVFGGTFDPVHFGHLRPALELKESLGLERVHLIPCNIPPHRGEPHASAAQRSAMLQLAIAEETGLLLDQRELQRPGPSYMVDTLRSLRAEYGKDTPLCLIIGSDAFLGLTSWYHWQELLTLGHLVVAHRPGWLVEPSTLAPELQSLVLTHRRDSVRQLHDAPAGGVWFQAVTQLEISATAIRQCVANGGSASFLLPQAVWRYIQQHGLYRQK